MFSETLSQIRDTLCEGECTLPSPDTVATYVTYFPLSEQENIPTHGDKFGGK
jgi:hypothetical protein